MWSGTASATLNAYCALDKVPRGLKNGRALAVRRSNANAGRVARFHVMPERNRREIDSALPRPCIKWILTALPLVAACSLAGCDKGGSGKPTAHLSGTVTIDGQPVPSDAWGTINFRSQRLVRPRSCADHRWRIRLPGRAHGQGRCFHSSGPANRKDDFRRRPDVAGDTPLDRREVREAGFELEVTEDNSNQHFELTSK